MADDNLKRTENHIIPDGDAAAVETNWSAVAAKMSAGTSTEAGPLGIWELQDRAASALSASESLPDIAMEIALKPWSARRQLAFFLAAGSVCWMLILAPVLF